MSTFETVLADVLARLLGSPPLIDKPEFVRRSHRTTRVRDDGPAVYVIDGPDAPKGKCEREGEFSIAIFVRDDAGASAADPIKVEVMRRLNPLVQAYADGVTVYPGKIEIDTEIADTDATRVDMAFRFCYAAPEWSLGGD